MQRVLKSCFIFQKSERFLFSLQSEKGANLPGVEHGGRHLHVCSATKVFFWCQQMESFILKVARFCPSFPIPFCSTTKRKRRTDPPFFIIWVSWGKTEASRMCDFNINGWAVPPENRPMFLNAWAVIHTRCKKKPFCFTPTDAVFGLRIAVGCPFKTVLPSTVHWECVCRKRCHSKAMHCARPGSSRQP